jgi:predicted permease
MTAGVLVVRLRQWLVRAGATLRPGRNDSDLEAELRTHLALAAEHAQRTGRSPDAAAREAVLQFGGLAQAMETLRDQRGLRWLSDLLRDLRYGCRLLARSPGFALVTIVTLALGMGANLVIFCLAEAFLLRPLPVVEPGRLVRIFSNNFSATPYTDYLDYRDSTRTLTSLAAFQLAPMSLRTSGAPERVFGMAITGNYFDTLGVRPSLGRTISEADDRSGAPGAAMLSDAFWRSRYGADPSVLGRIAILNGSPFTIVGICPAAFKGTMAPLLPDVWIPWNLSVFAPSATTLRRGQSAQMIGRLDDHSSPQAVQAELTAVASAAANRSLQSNHITRISAYPARTLVPEFAPQVTVFVGFLMALVGLVLLITCVNIASLLLARAAARRHEIATRLALGANRRRIVVQLLTESLLLSALGVAIALLLAVVMVRLLTSIRLPAPFPIDLNLVVDWRVVVFAIALALLTTVLFGLAPALRASRSSLIAALKGVATTSGREGSRSRTALVVAQVAMSTVLLITAGLLVRSLAAARDVNRGFSSDHVLRTTAE